MISGTIKIHGNFTLQQYTIASVQTDVRIPRDFRNCKNSMATLLSHSIQQFQSKLISEYPETLSIILGTVKLHGNFTLAQYRRASVQTDVRIPRDFRNCKNSMVTTLAKYARASVQTDVTIPRDFRNCKNSMVTTLAQYTRASVQIDVRIPRDPKHDFRNYKTPWRLYSHTVYNSFSPN